MEAAGNILFTVGRGQDERKKKKTYKMYNDQH